LLRQRRDAARSGQSDGASRPGAGRTMAAAARMPAGKLLPILADRRERAPRRARPRRAL